MDIDITSWNRPSEDMVKSERGSASMDPFLDPLGLKHHINAEFLYDKRFGNRIESRKSIERDIDILNIASPNFKANLFLTRVHDKATRQEL